MIKKIAFTLYPVSDMPRARQFYEKVLGLVPDQIFGESFLEYDLNGETFALGCLPEEAPAVMKGKNNSIAFEVNNLDEALEKVKQHNVPIVMDIQTFPACRMAGIQDPDGNVVTLHQLNQ